MYTDTIKTTELAEAVQAFADGGYDGQAMRPLMELLERQTDYIQKRFWKMVDQKLEEESAQLEAGHAHLVATGQALSSY
jgi:hypothetical protein